MKKNNPETKNIKKSTHIHAELIESLPCVVWEVIGDPSDKNQRIHYVSAYAVSLLGHSLKRWLETPGFWIDIMYSEDRERVEKKLKTIFLVQNQGIVRYRWVASDNTPVWVETRIDVMKDSKNTRIGIRAVTVDISAHMDIQRRKDEFISVVSHELKTPLTSIKAYAQLLKRQGDIEKNPLMMKYLGRMNVQVDRLTHLIFQLLDTTRIQAGKLILDKTEFSLDELILEIGKDVSHIAQTHSIHIDPLAQITVNADRIRIAQVLMNFLTNATKFSPPGSSIQVSAFVENGEVTVKVKDFGKGVAKEDQQQVFERFFQANRKSLSDQSVGLGLYIASEIIRQHEGTIGVKSAKGKGATFFFTLPLGTV